ncbi:hypothetical protein IWX47DRAFT_573686 [Phyllosticta citricarpa]
MYACTVCTTRMLCLAAEHTAYSHHHHHHHHYYAVATTTSSTSTSTIYSPLMSPPLHCTSYPTARAGSQAGCRHREQASKRAAAPPHYRRRWIGRAAASPSTSSCGSLAAWSWEHSRCGSEGGGGGGGPNGASAAKTQNRRKTSTWRCRVRRWLFCLLTDRGERAGLLDCLVG